MVIGRGEVPVESSERSKRRITGPRRDQRAIKTEYLERAHVYSTLIVGRYVSECSELGISRLVPGESMLVQ
jgi:hypothetical protein